MKLLEALLWAKECLNKCPSSLDHYNVNPIEKLRTEQNSMAAATESSGRCLPEQSSGIRQSSDPQEDAQT